MNKIIIAGSRSFKNYNLLSSTLDNFISELNLSQVVIVSGGAKGADLLGERYAINNRYLLQRFPAKWNDTSDKPSNEIKVNKYGKPYWVSAGIERNKQMADFGDALIAFWNGSSKGTKHMIDTATSKCLKVLVIRY